MSNFFDEIKKDAFGSHLNIQIESIGNVGALGFMTALPEHLNLSGRIHGGVLMALADVVAAHATVLKLPAGSCTTTIESKTNFIRSAGLVKINAKAVPIHVGRTTMVWQTKPACRFQLCTWTCVVRTNCWGRFSTTTSARSRSVCSSQAIGPPRRHKSFALRSRPLSPNSTVTSRRYG